MLAIVAPEGRGFTSDLLLLTIQLKRGYSSGCLASSFIDMLCSSSPSSASASSCTFSCSRRARRPSKSLAAGDMAGMEAAVEEEEEEEEEEEVSKILPPSPCSAGPALPN
jgi:hypothetical protein